MSGYVEKREAAAQAARRRAEDLGICVDMLLRSVPAIDDLARLLEASGAAPRLAKALRAELARRRGGRR